MDVDGRAGVQRLQPREHFVQALGRHGPQGVRRQSQPGRLRIASGPQAFKQAQHGLGAVYESALPRSVCTPTKAAVLVEHGQQRHADAGALGGAQQAERHLGRFGISLALGVVVQVMEFADAGVTRLQHVHIQARGNGLQLRGAELGGKSVHERAPAPEAVLRVAAVLGQPGQGALKSMRVQIGHARKHRPCGA